MTLPPCGIYKTTLKVGSIEAGQLVYFHNHGEPGPGLYLPKSWSLNRANWSERGLSLDDLTYAESLEALSPEGLYQVSDGFDCCEKKCQHFPKNALVQLGYNGGGEAIVFVPRFGPQGLAFPKNGQKISADKFGYLTRLIVGSAPSESSSKNPTAVLH